MGLTARDVKAALYRHFNPRYAVLTELECEAEGVAEYRNAAPPRTPCRGHLAR